MSAFLAGLASGAGDVYSEIADTKRKNQNRQNELLADSISKRLQEDETLTDEDALNLHQQELQLRGVPKKDIPQILQVSQYYHRMNKQQGQQMANPGAPLPESPAVPSQTVTPPAVHVPGQAKPDQGPASVIPEIAAGSQATLPPLPEYQPKTQGDYKTEVAGRRLEETNRQALALKSAEDRAAIQAKIDAYEQTTGQKMDPKQVAALIGAGGKGVKSTGGPLTAEDILKNDPEAVDVHGARIAAGSGIVYKQLVDTYGNPQGYVGATSTEKPGNWYRDDTSSTGWTQALLDPYGRVDPSKVVKNTLPPAAYLQRTNASVVPKIIQQADGSYLVVNTQSSSTSGRQIPGGTSGNGPIAAPGQVASPATPQGPAAPLPAGPAAAGPPPAGTAGLPPANTMIPPKPPAMPVKPQAKPDSSYSGFQNWVSQNIGGGQNTYKGGIAKPGQTVGHKSLSVEDQNKATQNMGQVSNTIDLVNQVSNRLPLVADLIDRGKIHFELHDGLLSTVINANFPPNSEEAKLAGDLKTLSEDINLLRAPLGATGFRGVEAFMALQAQAGSLSANPAVTQRTLQNTMRALNTQQQFWKDHPEYGVKVTPASPVPERPDASGKPKAPPVGTIEDGHRFKGGDPGKKENWEPVQGAK